MIHLVREWHDVVNMVTNIWCDAEWNMNTSDDFNKVDCGECLAAAIEYGEQAKARLARLPLNPTPPRDEGEAVSGYNPNSDDPCTHWRIMVHAPDRDTVSLRVQGEPNFMSRHHAWLLWQQLGEALRETDTCLACGRQVKGICHCENDE